MQKYPGAFTLLGFSLSHYLLFLISGITTHLLDLEATQSS